MTTNLWLLISPRTCNSERICEGLLLVILASLCGPIFYGVFRVYKLLLFYYAAVVGGVLLTLCARLLAVFCGVGTDIRSTLFLAVITVFVALFLPPASSAGVTLG